METPETDSQIQNICKKYGIDPSELLRRIFLKELGEDSLDLESEQESELADDQEIDSDPFVTDIEKELGPLIPPISKRRQ